MGKSKQKWYVVWKGKTIGIFDNWADTQEAVSGFAGAQYKSFLSKEEAAQAFASSYSEYEGKNTTSKSYTTAEKEAIGNPVTPSISVDAACSGNPGILEFRGVITDTGEELFAFGPYGDGTVNIGEFLALVEGLKYAQEHGIKLIYSDSRTAMAWMAKRKANTTLVPSDMNMPLFVALDEAETWLKGQEFEVAREASGVQQRLIAESGKLITIVKRETALRGEIPADYGRK